MISPRSAQQEGWSQTWDLATERNEEIPSVTEISKSLRQVCRNRGVLLDPSKYRVVHRAAQALRGNRRLDLERVFAEYTAHPPAILLQALEQLARDPDMDHREAMDALRKRVRMVATGPISTLEQSGVIGQDTRF